jgi:hypothetical protein
MSEQVRMSEHDRMPEQDRASEHDWALEQDTASEGDWETVEDALSDQTQVPEEDWTTEPDRMPWQHYAPGKDQLLEEDQILSEEDKLELEIAQQHDFIAKTAARDHRSTFEWRAYVKSYSRVRAYHIDLACHLLAMSSQKTS